MTKPRLGKVRALFYVFQQVMTGREMRVHQNFDTPSFGNQMYRFENCRFRRPLFHLFDEAHGAAEHARRLGVEVEDLGRGVAVETE